MYKPKLPSSAEVEARIRQTKCIDFLRFHDTLPLAPSSWQRGCSADQLPYRVFGQLKTHSRHAIAHTGTGAISQLAHRDHNGRINSGGQIWRILHPPSDCKMRLCTHSFRMGNIFPASSCLLQRRKNCYSIQWSSTGQQPGTETTLLMSLPKSYSQSTATGAALQILQSAQVA